MTAKADQFSLFVENDVFHKTDRYYTAGERLQYLFADDLGVSLTQNMYTPKDISNPDFQPYDRPWAGWMYLSVFKTWYGNHSEVFIEEEAGMTGPDSMAEETQKWFHKMIGSADPQGWKYQVPNHFGDLLVYRFTYKPLDSKYFAIDPYAGVVVGNLDDNAYIGLNVYAGYNLPAKRNSTRVITFKFGPNDPWNPYAYIWAGVEPRYVAYNMLLSDPKYRIHEESFVYDGNLGATLGLKGLELSFTTCFRSREFREQTYTERFDSLKLSGSF